LYNIRYNFEDFKAERKLIKRKYVRNMKELKWLRKRNIMLETNKRSGNVN